MSDHASVTCRKLVAACRSSSGIEKKAGGPLGRGLYFSVTSNEIDWKWNENRNERNESLIVKISSIWKGYSSDLVRAKYRCNWWEFRWLRQPSQDVIPRFAVRENRSSLGPAIALHSKWNLRRAFRQYRAKSALAPRPMGNRRPGSADRGKIFRAVSRGKAFPPSPLPPPLAVAVERVASYKRRLIYIY